MFSSLLSIYYCGGDCIEDINIVLKDHFGKNPFFYLCSPDTLLRRLKSLKTANSSCQTSRGTVVHSYNQNERLAKLTVSMLQSLGCFDADRLVLDYDNTIVFTEKADSKMTYKRAYGYQPAVCLLNEKNVLYLENRNGNADAKSFQAETIQRMFDVLMSQGIVDFFYFRADAASHQFEVFNTLHESNCTFYIGAVTRYVEKYFTSVEHWQKLITDNNPESEMWIGETTYPAFKRHYKADEEVPVYRLLIKRSPKKSKQISITTGDASEYRAVITNDFEANLEEALIFYNRRGAAEKQFDILKNDFGWSHLPFSTLAENCVFMHFSAMCRNLYNSVITSFSRQYKNVRITDRIKRFVFRFITMPAIWVRKARQWHLRIYSDIELQV